MNIKTTAYVSIIAAMSIWSCSFLFTQEALKSFSPITAVTIRMTLATCMLGLYGAMTGQLRCLDKRHIPLFLIAGFAQPFCYFVCEAFGLTMVSATIASVVLSTIPLFSPFFAWVIAREKVTWMNVTGIVISLAGVVILVFERETLVVKPLGLVLLLGAVVAANVYSACLKRVPAFYSNVSIVFYVHLTSLFFFWPSFLIFDLKHLDGREILVSSVISIIVLAVFASMIGYILFCKSVRVIGVTKANAFCNIMPAITALAVWIIFGETLPWLKWIGIVIVIAGLFISQLQNKEN